MVCQGQVEGRGGLEAGDTGQYVRKLPPLGESHACDF